IQATQQVQQRGLSGAAWPHEGDEVAFLKTQTDAAQGADHHLFHVVVLDQLDHLSNRSHSTSRSVGRCPTAWTSAGSVDCAHPTIGAAANGTPAVEGNLAKRQAAR